MIRFGVILMAALSLAMAHGRELPLPARAPDAPGRCAFRALMENLPLEEREAAIHRQLMAGNVPAFLRKLQPVLLEASVGGTTRSATIFVTPDYISVGSDDDFFLMPMTPLLAQRIADATSTTLPTRRMVDAIWSAARCRLEPDPIPPSPQMVTVPVFREHHEKVQRQRDTTCTEVGALIGGHKKDVVITPRLHDPATSRSVAIYGWHRSNGRRIQPLYLGHEETYADYSHGVRLVWHEALIDGIPAPIADVLTSEPLARLLSDEAEPFTPVAPPRYRRNDAWPPPVCGPNNASPASVW